MSLTTHLAAEAHASSASRSSYPWTTRGVSESVNGSASNKTGFRTSGSSSSLSTSMSSPARRAALISMGLGCVNIDCPDLQYILIVNQKRNQATETYCLMTAASRLNCSTLRATKRRVSNISSSLLPVPHLAKASTSRVRAQNTVNMRSSTLNGDFQNCYSNQSTQVNFQLTHLTECYKTDRDLENHGGVDDDF